MRRCLVGARQPLGEDVGLVGVHALPPAPGADVGLAEPLPLALCPACRVALLPLDFFTRQVVPARLSRHICAVQLHDRARLRLLGRTCSSVRDVAPPLATRHLGVHDGVGPRIALICCCAHALSPSRLVVGVQVALSLPIGSQLRIAG